MRGLILIPPIHSIHQPTVGVGYLKSYLQEAGFVCDTADLNIDLYNDLIKKRYDDMLIRNAFPIASRTFAGEILMSTLMFPKHESQMLLKVEKLKQKLSKHEGFYNYSILETIKKITVHPQYNKLKEDTLKFIKNRVNQIIKKNYEWIGFSVVVTNVLSALLLAREIKKYKKDIKIIFGGPHCNINIGKALVSNLSFIDVLVYGEGLETLREFLESFSGSSDTEINGTIVRKGKEVIVNPPRKQIENLDTIPFADWTDFNLRDYYHDESWYFNTVVIPIHTTSGCSHNKCSFCYNVSIWPHYYSRSVASVVEEMEYQAEKHRSNVFFFTDFDFNGEYDRTLALCEALISSKKKFIYRCWIRVDSFDAILLEKLYKSGCRWIFIGVEALDTNLLNHMRKGYDTKRVMNTLKILYEFSQRYNDFEYYFNLIPFHPGEEKKDVKNTLRIIRKNR